MIDPFLKWAGGKRWLAGEKLPRPSTFSRYIEPFLGGGAIFFSLLPDRAVLSDINSELISTYKVMRDAPKQLRDMLIMFQELHCAEFYYDMRENVPDTAVGAAARMLYLNRTCWNGLYRVNRKGNFNVPIGTKTAVVMPNDNFERTSEALKRASIYRRDFEISIDEANQGDFLFIDPPYTVKHNMNGFVKYNETIFSWEDQIRLRDAVRRAADRGVSIVLTNADHPSIIEIYEGIGAYSSVRRSSILAGLSKGRGPTTEAIFVANI